MSVCQVCKEEYAGPGWVVPVRRQVSASFVEAMADPLRDEPQRSVRTCGATSRIAKARTGAV